MRSLLPAAALIAACSDPTPSRPVNVVIASGAVLAEVDERFLSFAVDSAQAAGGYFWDPDGTVGNEGTQRVDPYDFTRPVLRRMARELAPAYLRIGGTAADRLYYDLSAEPVTEPPQGYEEVLTAEIWDGIADFADDLGLEIFFTLNAGPGPRDEEEFWTPDNARHLIEYTVVNQIPVAVWELGNEVNGYPLLLDIDISPYEFVADAGAARALLDEVDPDTPLAAPSSAYWPLAGEMRRFYPVFMANGGAAALDLVTWHYYPQQSVRCPLATRRAEPGLLLAPGNLDEVAVWADEVESIRDQHGPGLPVWLGESGNAQCGGEPGVSDAFEGGFWWLDQLGQLAHRGQPVVIRQTLSGSNYGLIDEATLAPNPDYFNSLLWRRLMGTRVLDATVDGGDDLLRVYAHCARESAPGQVSGAVAVLLLNLDEERIAEVTFDGVASGGAGFFELTAEELSSRTIRLNGTALAVDAEGAPPALEPVVVSPGSGPSRVRLAPLSYAFVTLPDAAAAACL